MPQLMIRELQQRRHAIRTAATEIMEKAERLGRDLTRDEELTFNSRMDEVKDLDEQISRAQEDRETERREIERELSGESGSLVFETAAGKRVRGYLPDEKMADPDPSHSVGRAILNAVTGTEPDSAREMGITPDPSGGFFLNPTMSARLVDQVRSQAILTRAGAITVPLDTHQTHFVRITSDPTAEWKAEHAEIADTDISVGSLLMIPKTIAAMVTISEELASDSVNAAATIEGILAEAVSTELDQRLFRGGNPGIMHQGIVNIEGAGEVDLDGPPVDYDPWLDAIGKIWAANMEPKVRIDAPRTAVDLAKLKRGDTEEQLRAPAEVEALRSFRTNQMPIDLGDGGDETVSVVGDFGVSGAMVLLGVREGLRVDATRVAAGAFERLQLKIRIWGRFDIAVARPSGLALVRGIEAAPTGE